jgi:hypothetical protein
MLYELCSYSVPITNGLGYLDLMGFAKMRDLAAMGTRVRDLAEISTVAVCYYLQYLSN